jgi:hypothetical protein
MCRTCSKHGKYYRYVQNFSRGTVEGTDQLGDLCVGRYDDVITVLK